MIVMTTGLAGLVALMQREERPLAVVRPAPKAVPIPPADVVRRRASR
ncbi:MULTISPECIES: hypothetical protein [unclassified Brevundimonas]|nr:MULTISPECIES: hypothetical protein [unclassified Brevundimonas]